jgi:hypothetical protein
MADQINDGGPAFPRDHAHIGHNGMTLRDYFAAKAMQAYIQAHIAGQTALEGEGFDRAISKWSYETADAMLKAREA